MEKQGKKGKYTEASEVEETMRPRRREGEKGENVGATEKRGEKERGKMEANNEVMK